MLEDRRQQFVLIGGRPTDDYPVQRSVSFEDRVLKNFGEVDPPRPTHFSARIDEGRRLLGPRMLHHVPKRLIGPVLDIFSALRRATAQKFNQARFEPGFVGFDFCFD